MAMDVDSGRGSDTGGAQGGGGDGHVPRSPGAGSVHSIGSSRRASTVGGSLSRRSRCARCVVVACGLDAEQTYGYRGLLPMYVKQQPMERLFGVLGYVVKLCHKSASLAFQVRNAWVRVGFGRRLCRRLQLRHISFAALNAAPHQRQAVQRVRTTSSSSYDGRTAFNIQTQKHDCPFPHCRRSRRRLRSAGEDEQHGDAVGGTPPREAAPVVGVGVSGWLSGTSRSSSMTSLAIDSEGAPLNPNQVSPALVAEYARPVAKRARAE